MAEDQTVSTVLSLNTATTNIIEIGNSVFISINNDSKKKGFTAADQGYTNHQNLEDMSESNSGSIDDASTPTAVAVGEAIGDKASTDVTVTYIGKGTYLVKFEPTLADDYSLSVFCSGYHIKGSPFSIKVVETGVLNGHWNPSSGGEPPVLSIGKTVNIVIPDEVFGSEEIGKRKLSTSVHNSLGVCDCSLNHLSHLRSTSVSFTPDIAGSYFIKMTLPSASIDEEEDTSKTFVVETDSCNSQAINCFIHSKDMHIFQKPQSFCNVNGGSIKFRISTQKVTNRHTDKLDVFCQGPGQALAKLSKEDSHSSIEICEMTPSAPGRYRLDVFWGGNPIKGNPFYVNFKPPRKRIGSDGLNLKEESFRVSIPHRFKLNCSDLGEGELEFSCRPTSGADAIVKRTISKEGKKLYHCQIVPRKLGQHEVWIKYDGHHIEQSPYKVHFKPRGDAAKCCMVSSPSFDETGGNVSFQISTAGAGEGRLVATAEEVNKTTHNLGAVSPVEVKQLSNDLYEIHFNPGMMSQCLVSVTYDNTDIFGSPFKMTFREVNQCEAYGEGLTSAQVGSWNRFNVSTLNAGPGALSVRIESEKGDRVDPIITRLTPSLLEVGYRPMEAGDYFISLNWGQSVIPGSPFCIKCYFTTVNVVKPPPVDIALGVPVKFKVHSSKRGLSLDDFSIVATNHQRETFRGKVRTDENGYIECSVTPPTRGNYKINIRWKDNDIRGSPFNVNIIAPHLPENVEVHCLKTAVPIGKGSGFWLDTSRAGLGLLSITVDSETVLHPFDVHSSSDEVDPRIIRAHFCPTHTGNYVINIRWAGQHVSGSPFKLTMTEAGDGGVAVGVANGDCYCDGNVNLQEGVTFF